MATITRIVCPMCMHNFLDRDIRTKKRFLMFDASKSHFVFIEETVGGKIAGTGRGYRGSAKATGFNVIERLTIEEAKNTHMYDDILLQIKQQVINLARELIRLGIMKRSDI